MTLSLYTPPSQIVYQRAPMSGGTHDRDTFVFPGIPHSHTRRFAELSAFSTGLA